MEPLAHSRCSEMRAQWVTAPAPRLGTEPSEPWIGPAPPGPSTRACGLQHEWASGQEPEAEADESYPAVVRVLSGRPRFGEWRFHFSEQRLATWEVKTQPDKPGCL